MLFGQCMLKLMPFFPMNNEMNMVWSKIAKINAVWSMHAEMNAFLSMNMEMNDFG